MNKYEEFLKNNYDVVFWVVVLFSLVSIYFYNTRLQKIYDFEVIDGDTVKIYFEKWNGNLNSVQNVRFLDIDCYEIKRTDKARRQAQKAGITTEKL